MKKFMSENGPVEKAFLNGYFFGDRLLEDVMFECVIGEDDEVKVLGVDEESKAYFSQLNEAHWMSIAQGYAIDRDIFSDLNGDDIWIEEE